jgi:hypothetical protein
MDPGANDAGHELRQTRRMIEGNHRRRRRDQRFVSDGPAFLVCRHETAFVGQESSDRRAQDREFMPRQKIRHDRNPVAKTRHPVSRAVEFDSVRGKDVPDAAGKLDVQFCSPGSQIDPAPRERGDAANQ